jgi:hypothetical protein
MWILTVMIGQELRNLKWNPYLSFDKSYSSIAETMETFNHSVSKIEN